VTARRLRIALLLAAAVPLTAATAAALVTTWIILRKGGHWNDPYSWTRADDGDFEL
jgi:hypothetical protein